MCSYLSMSYRSYELFTWLQKPNTAQEAIAVERQKCPPVRPGYNIDIFNRWVTTTNTDRLLLQVRLTGLKVDWWGLINRPIGVYWADWVNDYTPIFAPYLQRVTFAAFVAQRWSLDDFYWNSAIVRSFVRHEISSSNVSKTVWPRITKYYRDNHTDMVDNQTGYDVIIYFRSAANRKNV